MVLIAAMTSLLIKICGLSTQDTLDAALDAGADMVGFVFFPPSPRTLTFENATALSARVKGRALKVALSVDADDTLLEAIVEHIKPDLLQFHGRESADRVQAVKARFGLPVMKAIHVSQASDLMTIATYETCADRLLFDARPPKGSVLPGGNGAAFDWTILKNVKSRRPWMLSGGLSPDNVAEALAVTQAQGLDVSSGVETSPGTKDIALIYDFIRRARAAEKLPLG